MGRYSDRVTAAEEALAGFQAATQERRRALLLAYPEPTALPVDITEHVVSIMDRLTETLDWGSGFFCDEELEAFCKIADLLKIDIPDSVERPA